MKNVCLGIILFYLYLSEKLHQGEAKCRDRHGMKYFGEGCKYICHCLDAREQCNERTGSCASGCSKGWMGPGCQYSNIVQDGECRISKSYDRKYAKFATDNNITTCSESTIKANNPPWWRVTFKTHRYIDRVQFTTKEEYTGRNIALNKKTNSSRFDKHFSDSHTCVVDGMVSNDLKQCVGLSSHVMEQTLTVDLGSMYLFRGYEITSNDYYGDLFGTRIFKHQPETKYLPIGDVITRNTIKLERFFIPSPISSFKISRRKENTTGLNEKRLILCDARIWGDCVPYLCGFDCKFPCFCKSWERMTLEDRQAGICRNGCLPGWKGNKFLCNQECEHGTYGQKCLQNCSGNCRHGLSCNKIDGNCSEGCAEGWLGPRCNKKCLTGTYGLNCNLSCSKNCLDETKCRPDDGKCMNGCKAGWQNDTCSTPCDAGTYGIGCSSNCSGNCLKEPCSRTNGTCYTGCKDGWKGDKCDKVCDNGSYGQQCRWKCSEYCGDRASCHNIDGACIGGCQHGWRDIHCNKSCESGTFGENCDSICSINCINESCRPTDGQCIHRCKNGWKGKNCDQVKAIEASSMESKKGAATDPVVVGVSVGVVVLILAMVLMIIVILKKRRKEISESSVEHSRIYRSGRVEQPVHIENEDVVCGGIVNQPIEIQTYPEQQQQPDVEIKTHFGNEQVPLDANFEQSIYANLGQQKNLHDINIKDLKQFIERTSLEELYADFERLTRGLKFPTEAALAESNRPKNRYREIYPYDHCRVVLSKQQNDPHSDYVNASYINGFHGTKSYIAAAAPIDTSVNDFWRMIWEAHTKTIVMVTHLEEAGKVKCLKYWPNINETLCYDELAVNTIREEELDEFTVRTLLVTKQSGLKQQEITHYHYTAWPDKDVPNGCTGMIHFLQYIRTRDQTRKSPWLVHCSAGVGRTGTFIALDRLYTEGQNTGSVNVYQCVFHLREQRVNCVQTREQYQFLHEVLYEIFVLPSSSIGVDVYKDICKQMHDLDPVSNMTNLELLYQNLTEFRRGSLWRGSQERQSKAKKRHNVILTASGQDNSKEIENAFFFPSYHCQRGYISSTFSQGENQQLLLKFIVQEKIELIVSLDSPSQTENEHSLDWLPENGQRKIGRTVVSCQSTRVENTYVVKMYEIKQAKSFHETNTIWFKCWSPNRLCPSSVESMIDFIDTIRAMRGSSRKPVLILSSDGVTKCGVFCILLSVVDRALAENKIDIGQTIRYFESRNPDFAITFEQFKFCHEYIEIYLQKDYKRINYK